MTEPVSEAVELLLHSLRAHVRTAAEYAAEVGAGADARLVSEGDLLRLQAAARAAADALTAFAAREDELRRELEARGIEAFTLRNERDSYKAQSANWLRLHNQQEARAEEAEARIAQAVADERESCAAMAEDRADHHLAHCDEECRCANGWHIADAIRSRSKETTQ